MTQVNQTVTIWAGDDTVITTIVRDSAGTALDISGVLKIQWNLKRSKYESANILTKTLGSGVAFTTDGTDGSIDITVSEVDTQSLVPARYYHELRLEDQASDVSTISTGSFYINPSEEVA